MPYKLILPAQTKAQIDACIAYIAQVLRNPDAARAVLDDIVHTYERLEHLLEAFPLCDDTYLRAKAYRKITLLHHNYVFIYRIEGRTVYLVGFFHMRENYREKL